MKKFLVYLIILLFVPSSALGCMCASANICRHFNHFSHVFVGRVLSSVSEGSPSGPYKFNPQVTRFRPLYAWKGIKDDTDVLLRHAVAGSSCGIRFSEGGEYLVFANVKNHAELTTGLCSNTKVVANVREAELRRMGEGRVLSSEYVSDGGQKFSTLLSSIDFKNSLDEKCKEGEGLPEKTTVKIGGEEWVLVDGKLRPPETRK